MRCRLRGICALERRTVPGATSRGIIRLLARRGDYLLVAAAVADGGRLGVRPVHPSGGAAFARAETVR